MSLTAGHGDLLQTDRAGTYNCCRFRDKVAISGFLGQRVSDFRRICQRGTMALWADARCSSGTAPSPATRSRRRGTKHVLI